MPYADSSSSFASHHGEEAVDRLRVGRPPAAVGDHRVRGEPGEADAGEREDRSDRLDALVDRPAADHPEELRVAGAVHAHVHVLDAPDRDRRVRDVPGGLDRVDGDDVGLVGEHLLDLVAGDVGQVADVAEPLSEAMHDVRLDRLDRDDAVEPLLERDRADVRVVPVLLGHRVGPQTEPFRLGRHHPRIGGDRVEVEDVRRSRDRAGLVQRERRLQQVRVLSLDPVEQHAVLRGRLVSEGEVPEGTTAVNAHEKP